MICGLQAEILNDGSILVMWDDGSGGESRVFETWLEAREWVLTNLDNWHEEK